MFKALGRLSTMTRPADAADVPPYLQDMALRPALAARVRQATRFGRTNQPISIWPTRK
jgi:hypothetical protein